MKSYRAVIFDLDGTLLDNRASFEEAYEKLTVLYPISFSDPRHFSLDEMIALYKEKENDPIGLIHKRCEETGWRLERSPEQFFSFWCDLYLDHSILYPEAIPLLRDLRKKGCKLAIITNGETSRQNRKLRSSKVDREVEFCLVSGRYDFEKPDKRIFDLALDRLGTTAEETLMVGNNPASDIQGAKNAGMDSFLIVGREPDFATYSGTLRDLSELLL